MARGFASPLRRKSSRRAFPPANSGTKPGTSVAASVVPGCGRVVRIFAEGMRIALREDLHHPAIKVIHRVVHDGFEPPVVFSMSFLNVITLSDADIFVLSAEAHLLRP